MGVFEQHIPDYVDYREAPPRWEFNTTEDLCNLPPMLKAKENPKFSHFAISGNDILKICDDGFYWWVVGSVDDAAGLELPAWDGGKYRAELEDGTIAVLTRKEVVSSCGGVLKLKNGGTAQCIR